jgi:hypothetical protein
MHGPVNVKFNKRWFGVHIKIITLWRGVGQGKIFKSVLYIEDFHWFFGVQRRVLVSTVLNIFVSYITETFLSSREDMENLWAVVNAVMNLRVS